MLDKNVSDYFERAYRRNPGIKKGMRYFKLMFSVTDGLYKMRRAAGLTQGELAHKLNTTQSMIASWETPGYDGYTLKKIFSIAEQLGHMVEVKFIKVPQTPTITKEVSADLNDVSTWIDEALSSRGLSAINVMAIT